jgi:Flp pilus assembly protein TadD
MTHPSLPSALRSHDPAQLLLGAAEGVPLVPVEAFGPDATPMMIAVREPPVCGEWSYDDREVEEPGGTVLTAVVRPAAASPASQASPIPEATPIAEAAPMAPPVRVVTPTPTPATPAPTTRSVAAPPVPPSPPTDPVSAHGERIEALAAALRYDEAEGVLRELERTAPDAPQIALYAGILACRRARWKDAVAPLRQAAGRLPDHAVAHYHLGEALNKCDDLAGALVAYQRAAELDPTHWRALKGVGIVYDRLGRPEAAAPFYRRARDAQRA